MTDDAMAQWYRLRDRVLHPTRLDRVRLALRRLRVRVQLGWRRFLHQTGLDL